MDTNWTPLIVIILALVVIAVIWGYSDRIRATFKIPGMSFKVEGENHSPETKVETVQQTPGSQAKTVIRKAKSREGGAFAEDDTGGGALIEDVEVADDLIAVNRKTDAAEKKSNKSPDSPKA